MHVLNRVAEGIKLEVGMLNKQLKMVERNVKSCQLISQPVTNIHAQVGDTYYLKLFEVLCLEMPELDMFFSFQWIVDGVHMEFGVSAPRHVVVGPGRVLEELNKRQQMGECLAWVKLKEQWNVIRRPAQVRKFSSSDLN